MAVVGTILRGFAAVVSVAAFVAVGGGPASAEPGPDGHMYGAYAISALQPDGSYQIGSAWNFPNQAGADGRAITECGVGTCSIAFRYMDGCGAIAFRGDRFAGAAGANRDEAARNAVNAVGPPWPSSISADASEPAQVFGPDCNGQ
ncbi:DUF4189 domain-containing protein [Nocardia sp. NPDC051030]|uniref:DUF4189 domain-containing protein n=1 Tax=Nocardia sp. NPDC051030 TaxID=3155162 RepID=UPI003414826B